MQKNEVRFFANRLFEFSILLGLLIPLFSPAMSRPERS